MYESDRTMTKLLYVNASPRKETSHTAKIAEAYINQRLADDPSIELVRLDLWQANLPEFDGDKAAAKMTFFGVGELDDGLESAWDEIVKITNQFIEADEYVFAVPMWNGGVPYKLKQYLDIITQPGLLFGFTPEDGYFGLLENKSAAAFYTAGVFAPGVPSQYGQDFHSTYLSWWFDLVGITNIRVNRFQPSLLTADPQGDEQEAVERSIKLAKNIT